MKKFLKDKFLSKFIINKNYNQYSIFPILKSWKEIKKSSLAESRINIFIPSIDPDGFFGGTSTALKCFEEFTKFFPNKRILVCSQIKKQWLSDKKYAQYQLVSSTEDNNTPNQIVDVSQKQLVVAKNDIFMATHWITAYIAQQYIQNWQKQEYQQEVKPIIYLIQDYEPGFCLWSTHYMLVLSTYEIKNPVIAIFNTKLLQNYFHAQGFRFTKEYSFECQMNSCLLKNLLAKDIDCNKSRTIIVYGRPNAARNCFSMIVEGLKIWQQEYPLASNWKIISAGTPHPDIELTTNGIKIKSVGKLSLEDYAQTLREAAIGLSFMASPHPSYPPLEMAHFGILVITNRFANKDISLWHDNILSLPQFTPQCLASELAILCNRFESNNLCGIEGKSYIPDYLNQNPLFPFAKEIVDEIIA